MFEPLLDRFLQKTRSGGQDQQSQSHGQENLPSDLHELVKAVTRERATIPDIEVHEARNLRAEPVNVADPVADTGNEQDQSDQSEHGAECAESQGLNPEQRMFR